MAGGTLDPQGPAAESMAGLWWLMLGLGVAVFVIFAVVLALGLFRWPWAGWFTSRLTALRASPDSG